jgi:FtsZ-interacting cell division protein ZipA
VCVAIVLERIAIVCLFVCCFWCTRGTKQKTKKTKPKKKKKKKTKQNNASISVDNRLSANNERSTDTDFVTRADLAIGIISGVPILVYVMRVRVAVVLLMPT